MSGASGSTYSVPLLTTTSQVSGSQISIAPSFTPPPVTVSTPSMDSMISPSVSAPQAVASTSPPPTTFLPTVSSASPALPKEFLSPISGAMSTADYFMQQASTTGFTDGLGNPGVGRTALPITPSPPGPSGTDVNADSDPEEIILKSYTLLQQIMAKLDAMVRNDATTMSAISRTYSGLSGVGNNVQNTVSTVQDIQSQVTTLTDTVNKVISTNVAPEAPPAEPQQINYSTAAPEPPPAENTNAETNNAATNKAATNNAATNNAATNNAATNNAATNNAAANNAGTNGEPEEEVAEGGRRNRSQKAKKKGRRTHKRR